MSISLKTILFLPLVGLFSVLLGKWVALCTYQDLFVVLGQDPWAILIPTVSAILTLIVILNIEPPKRERETNYWDIMISVPMDIMDDVHYHATPSREDKEKPFDLIGRCGPTMLYTVTVKAKEKGHALLQAWSILNENSPSRGHLAPDDMAIVK